MLRNIQSTIRKHLNVLNSPIQPNEEELRGVMSQTFSELRIVSDIVKIMGSMAFLIGINAWAWNHMSATVSFMLGISSSTLWMFSSTLLAFTVVRLHKLIIHTIMLLDTRIRSIFAYIMSIIASVLLSVMVIYSSLNFFAEASHILGVTSK